MVASKHHTSRTFNKLSADKPPNLINCVLLNARSVNNKLPELHNLSCGMNYGIVIVSKSWLRPSTSHDLLDPLNKFIIVRSDRRSELPGGDVCIFKSVLYSVATVKVNTLYPELEICCLDWYYEDIQCRLFAIYRAPSFNDMSRIIECL